MFNFLIPRMTIRHDLEFSQYSDKADILREGRNDLRQATGWQQAHNHSRFPTIRRKSTPPCGLFVEFFAGLPPSSKSNATPRGYSQSSRSHRLSSSKLRWRVEMHGYFISEVQESVIYISICSPFSRSLYYVFQARFVLALPASNIIARHPIRRLPRTPRSVVPSGEVVDRPSSTAPLPPPILHRRQCRGLREKAQLQYRHVLRGGRGRFLWLRSGEVAAVHGCQPSEGRGQARPAAGDDHR